MWYDVAAAPTLSRINTTLVCASLPLNTHTEKKNTQQHWHSYALKWQKKQTSPVLWEQGQIWNFGWQICWYFHLIPPYHLLLEQQSKDETSLLNHKPLKGTEWILIRSGVVSSAHRGLSIGLRGFEWLRPLKSTPAQEVLQRLMSIFIIRINKLKLVNALTRGAKPPLPLYHYCVWLSDWW